MAVDHDAVTTLDGSAQPAVQFQALEITGVDASAVGSPTSVSGGRYSVPIGLSRSLDYREVAVLIGLWDGRDGAPRGRDSPTARLSADQFILTDTTIDDVASHHARALRLVVDRFNLEMPRLLCEQSEREARAAAAAAEHRIHVEEVARTVRFD